MPNKRWIRNRTYSIATTVLCGMLALPLDAAEDHAAIQVDSIARLQEVIRTAAPGDVIELADGVYDASCTISASGTADQPIVIRAQTIGKAVIHQEIRIRGNYLSLVGLQFSGKGGVAFQGRGCRLSQCRMTNVQAGKWVAVAAGSTGIEIDHCLFEKKEENRKLQSGCQLIQIQVLNKGERHHIHHNHFRDIPKGATGNGFETLQLITRGNPKDPAPGNCETVIEDNLFERCNGESEIISVKSNGNMIRRNTFRACRGALVFRHGDGNTATQNIFLGDGEPGSGGIRLQGTDHVIANNYFGGLGTWGVSIMDGTKDHFYVQVERAKVLFNTFANCKQALLVGVNHSKYPIGFPPKQCVIAGNIFYSPSDGDAGDIITLVNGDSPEAWTWRDNLAYGTLGIPPTEGIRMEDPNLRLLANGLVVPTTETPATEQMGTEMKEAASIDLFGNPRGVRRTLGAVQFGVAEKYADPLSEEQVGPQAAD